MGKKYAFLFTLAVTFVIGIDYWYMSSASGSGVDVEKVVIKRALDGDTFDLTDGRRVRMLNVNTPENGEFGSDKDWAYLKKFENKTVKIEVTGRETYGRLLARVYTPEYINLEIIRQGLAHTLLVQDSEVKEFAKAQKEAIENERGIWEHSAKYGCLSGEIYKKEEYVVFDKRCEVSLVGWTVSDETTHKYTFKKDPEEKFVFYSANGAENRTALFWNRGKAWNDDRDSLVVRDSEGKLVYYSDYGY